MTERATAGAAGVRELHGRRSCSRSPRPPGLVGVIALTHESLHAGVLGFDGILHAQRTVDPYPYGPADRA